MNRPGTETTADGLRRCAEALLAESPERPFEDEPTVLPEGQRPLPPTDRPVAEEVAATTGILPGTGTILVVDDEAGMLHVLSRQLQKLGYDVLTASDGGSALEIVREHREEIRLVMMDMVMPGMDGRQLYDSVQEIAPGMKVLLSSGFSLEGDAQKMLAQGCNGFIQKPFGAAALSAKLREIL